MTLTSQYDGKCKGFKNPDSTITIHTWVVGNEIYYQKDPKCICINEACFNQQKGAAGQTPPPAGQTQLPTPSVDARTESEKTDDAKHMVEICWTIAHAKALEVIPATDDESDNAVRQRLIVAQVMFKAATYSWTRR